MAAIPQPWWLSVLRACQQPPTEREKKIECVREKMLFLLVISFFLLLLVFQ